MNKLELPQIKTLKFSAFYAFLVGFAVTFMVQMGQTLVIWPSFFYPFLFHFLLPLAFLTGTGSAIILLMGWFHVDKNTVRDWLIFPTKPINFLLGFICFFFSLPFAEWFTGLIPTDAPILQDLYKTFENSFLQMLNYKVAGFITVCILAPILEEILFRGFILRGILNSGTPPWIAILVSGIIFGAAHLNPWQFIGAGILGIIFGFIYYKTKSLLLVIFLHAANNIFSFIMMMKYKQMDEQIIERSSLSPIFISLIISLIAAYFLSKKNIKHLWN